MSQECSEFSDLLRIAALKSRQINVGVIGAGFAGLRAADVLLQHGFKGTVLEARDRLGGKVAQSDHLGHRVDLGANWIHGVKDNPIMKIASQTETKLHACDGYERAFNSDGVMLDTRETEEYGEILWREGLLAEAFTYSETQRSLIDKEKSLYDFFDEKAESLFSDESPKVAQRKRSTFLQLVKMWGSYIGSPVTTQSLRYFWLEECLEDEDPFVAETYRKIFDAVAAPTLEHADVCMNTEAISIRSAQQNDQESGDAKQAVVVSTADGKESWFDEVVVTVPLGVLKRDKDMFAPDLPAELKLAIESIHYGTLDKVYVTFPVAFWPSSPQPQARRFMDGRIAAGKNAHDIATKTTDQTETETVDFFHWLEPNYTSSTNPERWNEEAMNLAGLRADCAHPTLLFYIHGSQSKHIAEMVKSAQDEQDKHAKLKAFFEPYYSLLPSYNSADPACTPSAILATAWAGDRFAGFRSYSNFQVGLENAEQHIEVMRHGMPERHIWLAGEHTAPFEALGTTTGAYLSGEAVANRIASAYGVGKEHS